MKRKLTGLACAVALIALSVFSVSCKLIFGSGQPAATVKPVSPPNSGGGLYTNPVIFADYSDPDVIRVGDDFT